MSLALAAAEKNTNNVMVDYLNAPVHVAIGIILNLQQDVLLALRHPHADQGGLWEFPGGKMEGSESSYQALCRELKEELDIQIVAATRFTQVSHVYESYTVELHVWKVTRFSGNPKGMQGQPIRWVSRGELSAWPLPPANRQIVSRLSSDVWAAILP